MGVKERQQPTQRSVRTSICGCRPPKVTFPRVVATLLVSSLLTAVILTRSVGFHGMVSQHRTDVSKVKAVVEKQDEPLSIHRPPTTQQLQSEDDGPDELLFGIPGLGRLDRTEFASIHDQEGVEEVEETHLFAKTLQHRPLIPNPKTEAYTLNRSKMIRTSLPKLKTRQSATKETCDKTCRWWREQHDRQHRVQETCAKIKHKPVRPPVHYSLTPQTLRILSHLLVLDSHKLIYCYVPKVGCTNWKRIFLVAKGVFPSVRQIEQRQTHIATDSHIRTLSSYPITQASRLLKEYRKFMFVRHPFERVLSAYIDKFQLDYPSSKHFREVNAAQMARYSDYNNMPRMKDGTLNITFQAFSRYVSDPKNLILEPHWSEMYSQCQPCLVQYDFLGKYDTLKEDADFIIDAAKLNLAYPESTNPTGSSEKAKIQRYFSNLTEADIDSLYRRYHIDFKLFGYSVPSFISNRTYG